MTPETVFQRACLAVAAVCATGLWLLRDGTRVAVWLDNLELPDLGTEHDR